MFGCGLPTPAKTEEVPNVGLQTRRDDRVREERGFPELGAQGNLQSPGSG